MTDGPLCPDCGRLLVYLSSPQVYKCFKCSTPPEPQPTSWWFWLTVLGMVILMAFLIWISVTTGLPPMENLTVDQDVDDPDSWSLEGALIIIGMISAIGILVAYTMEKNRERCPSCGEVLKKMHTGDYYCLHCRSMFDAEDIEVEVVE